jgi:hypothetical protein
LKDGGLGVNLILVITEIKVGFGRDLNLILEDLGVCFGLISCSCLILVGELAKASSVHFVSVWTSRTLITQASFVSDGVLNLLLKY